MDELTFQLNHSTDDLDSSKTSDFIKKKNLIKDEKTFKYFSSENVLGLVSSLSYFSMLDLEKPYRINLKNFISVFDSSNNCIAIKTINFKYNKLIIDKKFFDPDKYKMIKEIESTYSSSFIKSLKLIGLAFTITYKKLLKEHHDPFIHTFVNPTGLYYNVDLEILFILSPLIEYKDEFIHN